MIDHAKRKTLKRVGAMSVATAATVSGAVHAIAPMSHMGSPDAPVGDDAELASFRLHTRLSARTNDIEVVLTNTGEHAANITHMTPQEILTPRGRFVFTEIFDDDGQLAIDAGQSVSVAMKRHPVVLDASDMSYRVASLSAQLCRSASIVVDGESFAPLTVVSHGPFV